MKEIGNKHFSEVFNNYIPTLAKRILSEGLNLHLSKFKYIDQVFEF